LLLLLLQVFHDVPQPPVLKIADFGYCKAYQTSDPKTKVWSGFRLWNMDSTSTRLNNGAQSRQV
jgi:hypothetical protein